MAPSGNGFLRHLQLILVFSCVLFSSCPVSYNPFVSSVEISLYFILLSLWMQLLKGFLSCDLLKEWLFVW